MNKRLIYSGGILLIVILFISYYYTRTSDVKLAKLTSGDGSTEFTPSEAVKMTIPSILKNTVMNLKPLKDYDIPLSAVIGKTTEDVIVPNPLISDNGEYKLVMQEDANLVIYTKDNKGV